MPLLERVRVEVYLPDLPSSEYQHLLRSFEEEFTYAFGGSSIIRGLDGSYLSGTGERIPDRINVLYSDAPLALSRVERKAERGRPNSSLHPTCASLWLSPAGKLKRYGATQSRVVQT